MNLKRSFLSLSFVLVIFLSPSQAQGMDSALDWAKGVPQAYFTLIKPALELLDQHKLASTAVLLGGLYAADSLNRRPLTWRWDKIIFINNEWKMLNTWKDEALEWPDKWFGTERCEIEEKLSKAISNLNLPKKEKFLWGVATSAHQVERCDNNDWAQAAAQGKVAPAGNACEHEKRWKEDIQLIKNLGANTYRFSCEWSKVMPKEGTFDEKVLKHYEDVCKELVRQGLKPCITLYHYTQPIWFAEKGGFEKEKNIKHFVQFSQKLFQRLGKYVHLWFTFNAPSGVAYKSHLKASTPPYKKDMQLAVEVLKNVLESHVQVYQAAKKINKDYKVGILKNIYQLDPYNPFNPLDRLGSYMGNMLANTCIYNFFRTGEFKVWIPKKVYVYHKNEAAKKSNDFIGLNYYSHGMMKNFKVVCPSGIKVGKENHTIYAEGLYRAIKELHQQFNLPIFITENGYGGCKNLSDKENCERRKLFLNRYWYAMAKAIEDGYPVHGYIHWSLMDNYEWGTHHKRYGLYHVDFATQKRTLKSSGKFFADVITAVQNPTVATSSSAVPVAS